MPNIKPSSRLIIKPSLTNNSVPTKPLHQMIAIAAKKPTAHLKTKSVIYQAIVTRQDSQTQETYVGLTENSFKKRFANHASSFRNSKQQNSTELSKYVWSLKHSDISYSIKWKILKRCKSYSSVTKRCNLCLYEKFIIICHPELCTLNQRNELVSNCRHRKKHLLCNK